MGKKLACSLQSAVVMEGRVSEKESGSVVSELEGSLLRDPDPFPYFMLVAFEASGLVRFALLLLLWPVVRLLHAAGRWDLGLRVMVFVATAGVQEAELEAVARAVLPKFYMDDVDMEAWRVFSACGGRRVVVTGLPRVMVERFAKDHLGADAVVGGELEVGRYGLATGLLKRKEDSVAERVRALFEGGDEPGVGLGRPTSAGSFLSLCKVSASPSPHVHGEAQHAYNFWVDQILDRICLKLSYELMSHIYI